MTTPHLIREEILLNVEDAEKVEYDNSSFGNWLFYVGDAHGRLDDVQRAQAESVVESHRPAGFRAEVRPFTEFTGMSSRDVKLQVHRAALYGYVVLEDLVKLVHRFVPNVQFIAIDDRDGPVRIYVADSNRRTPDEMLQQVQQVVTANSHLEDSRVIVVPYQTLPGAVWTAPTFAQGNGIQAPAFCGTYTDPLIKRIAYDSEEEFEGNLYGYAKGSSSIRHRLSWLNESSHSILWNPFSARLPPLKHLLVLYDRVYYMVSPDTMRNIPDALWTEIVEMAETGSIVPVFIHPLYTYPARSLRQITERPNARYLLPRQLDEIILDWCFSTSMPWTSYRNDYHLSQRMMNVIRLQEINYFAEPGFDVVIHAVKEDMKFQQHMARCAEEELWNNSFTRFAMIAPGSPVIHLVKENSLELMTAVQALMFASALGASITPSEIVPHAAFSMIANIGYGNFTRPFASIQPIQDLERVLTGLEIMAPEGIPLTEWGTLLQDLDTSAIQRAVNSCLTNSYSRERLITEVDEQIKLFNNRVSRVQQRKSLGELIEAFDILSLAMGYAGAQLGITNPADVWMLNHIAKGFVTGIALKRINGVSLDDIVQRLRFMSDVDRGVVNVLKVREAISSRDVES